MISSFCCAVQLRYFLCSLNLVSLSVERPILSQPPDSPSGATRPRDSPAHQPSHLSTRDRGAGHSAPSVARSRGRSREKEGGDKLRQGPGRDQSRRIRVHVGAVSSV